MHQKLDVLFSFTFFCWLQLKIMCGIRFHSALVKSTTWAWVRKAERIVCQAWWLSALLQPPRPDQGSSSCSTAIRSFCMLWVSCWLIQRDRRNYLAKSSSIQMRCFFCLSQSVIHRVVISGSLFSCLVIPAGSSMVLIASIILYYGKAWTWKEV